jgi:NAD(P)-dependent dehydrogenase (short-subunit alcohol dehydrogenase family)
VRIAILARSSKALTTAADSIAPRSADVLPLPTDITDYNACENAVRRVSKHFGRIDGLVNNAGVVTPVGPVAAADVREWQNNIHTNLLGAFNCIHAAIGLLRASRGRVVNVSSGAASLALENLSAYCAAKAALNQLTRVLSLEEPDLTCLAVRPGMVDTVMQSDIREKGKDVMGADQVAFYRGFKERGELLPPRIPAKSIAWLVLAAPPRLDGGWYDADDPDIMASADAFFRNLG